MILATDTSLQATERQGDSYQGMPSGMPYPAQIEPRLQALRAPQE